LWLISATEIGAKGDIIKEASDFDAITANFYKEALRLRAKYESQIDILIGFETEWIRDSSLKLIEDLRSKYDWDLFVGSLHHVHTIPIDFDRPFYEKARLAAGGSDEQLFADYFDDQLEMIHALKPPIVGHFDLIRLQSDEPNASLSRFDGVWSKVCRNLEIIASYGGILELNSAALRKGLNEPYPSVDICKVRQKLVSYGQPWNLTSDPDFSRNGRQVYII
jgi:histidinol-phosphatase (PHP family)